MTTETTHPHATEPDPEKVREINESIRYTMWSVFAATSPLGDDRSAMTSEVESFLGGLGSDGVVVRGVYDVAGLRADADLMVWWHAPTIEALQAAYHGLLRTEFGHHLSGVWSVAGVHRPMEFNKSHVPAWRADDNPGDYICVYPFVRSYDWYVLDDAERSQMLREHGQLAAAYPQVRGNTTSSFALSDYEWILAFESPQLHDIVDVMRELRAARARLHVREEIPFYTGPRVDPAALIAALR